MGWAWGVWVCVCVPATFSRAWRLQDVSQLGPALQTWAEAGRKGELQAAGGQMLPDVSLPEDGLEGRGQQSLWQRKAGAELSNTVHRGWAVGWQTSSTTSPAPAGLEDEACSMCVCSRVHPTPLILQNPDNLKR